MSPGTSACTCIPRVLYRASVLISVNKNSSANHTRHQDFNYPRGVPSACERHVRHAAIIFRFDADFISDPSLNRDATIARVRASVIEENTIVLSSRRTK